jgi:hypothetical protein
MSHHHDIGEPRLARSGVAPQRRRSIARRPNDDLEERKEHSPAPQAVRRVQRHQAPIRSQIAALGRQHRGENGREGIHIHPVVEDGVIQSRNVRLTVRGRVDVYEGRQTIETIDIEEVEYAVVRFRTRNQLIDGVKQQLERLTQKCEDLEADSPKKVFYPTWKGAQDGFSNEHLHEHAQRPDIVEMYSAKPIDNRRLKGSEVNRLKTIDKEQFNCVVEYLLATYQPKIPTLTRERIAYLMANKQELDMVDAKQWGWRVQDVQRFCDEYQISHYVMDSFFRLVHKKAHNSRNHPALMYYCEDAHMYPITDDTVRKRITASFAERSDTQTNILAQDSEKKKAEVEKKKIKMFNPEKKYYEDIDDLNDLAKLSDCVVYYHKLHLKDMLLDIYRQTDVMYDFHHTGKIVTYIAFDNNVHLFANVNHKAGCDWNTSMNVAEQLGLAYKNQSLAGLSQEYFVKNYHPKGKKQARVNISKEVKKQIYKQQGGKCNSCGQSLKDIKWECDHVVPISCGGDALARSNLQILDKACHLEKTSKEAAEMIANIDNSCSYYNEKTLEIFGRNPLNAIVHNFMPPSKGKILAGLDINKCRANIWLYGNQTEWNCFSVLNDPVRFNKSLHYREEKFLRGFYYVESTNLLPLKGNSWLCVAAVEHCLKYKVITMDQIKFIVPSSLGLAPDYFQKFVAHVQEAVPEQKLWKLMVNSLIGIMGVRKAVHRDFKILLNKQAAAAYILEKQDPGSNITISPRLFDEEDENGYGEDGIMDKPDFYEVMFSREKLREESHWPIYAQVLQQEACELHLIQMLLEKHGGKLVHVNTDNAIAMFDNQKQVDAMWAEASKICWDKDNKVQKYKMANEINNYERTDHINTDKYEHAKPVYHVENDPGHNDFNELAKFVLKKKQSFQIDSMAGCGKTTVMRAVIGVLDSIGEKWLACTPTHKSAKVLYQDKNDPKRSAKTIHRALGQLKFGGHASFSKFNQYDWILVDEKSMIKENFFLLMYKIKKACPGVKFIICGDWGQIPPVMDRSLTFNYANSYCVWDLCDGNMLRLNKCRRSDRPLFELYSNIEDVNPAKFPTELYQKNVCFLNKTRKDINYYWMMKLAPKHKTRMILKANRRADQSQDTILYSGLPLIAMATRTGLGFSNADEFTVVSFDQNNVQLKYDNDDPEAEDKFILVPTVELTHFMAPAYAISCHRMQGSSISQPFGIFDWDKMDAKLQYVALSRSRKLKYINMCSLKQLQ